MLHSICDGCIDQSASLCLFLADGILASHLRYRNEEHSPNCIATTCLVKDCGAVIEVTRYELNLGVRRERSSFGRRGVSGKGEDSVIACWRVGEKSFDSCAALFTCRAGDKDRPRRHQVVGSFESALEISTTARRWSIERLHAARISS